jgi:hypothetical protein
MPVFGEAPASIDLHPRLRRSLAVDHPGADAGKDLARGQVAQCHQGHGESIALACREWLRALASAHAVGVDNANADAENPVADTEIVNSDEEILFADGEILTPDEEICSLTQKFCLLTQRG